MKAVFATNEVLFAINARLSEVFHAPYREEEVVISEGYLPIHESYKSQIMQVLQEFVGRYEIKRAVLGEPDEDGNVEITWQKVG